MYGLECEELSFSSLSADLGAQRVIQKIAILAPIAVFHLYTEISDDQRKKNLQRSPRGPPMAIYSSLTPTSLEWQNLDVIARRITIKPVYDTDIQFTPTVMITACSYETPISYFKDSPFTVDSHKAGVVSMYENHLRVLFRTFENGIFVFSMADQGDLLIAQIVRGVVYVIFDFGSLTHSTISGGVALNDGEWHEMQWVHQFDSVQLIVDGAVLNISTPSGPYRKLDFDSHIHVAGRPPDDMSGDIEISFHGCLGRVMLNNVDLLAEMPKAQWKACEIRRSQPVTIARGGSISIPFSFFPFSVEFRILPQPADILVLADAKNLSILQITLDSTGAVTLASNISKVKQQSHPACRVSDGSWHAMSLMISGSRLHIDVDETTVLWVEGAVVRSIAMRLAYFYLSAVGCYRSWTIDFGAARKSGGVFTDRCSFINRCVPNPCHNGGKCHQTTLSDFRCVCKKNFYGRVCHASRLSHSCEESFLLDGNDADRNASLDIDGGQPLKPFFARCKRGAFDDEVTTTLFHDLEASGVFVTGTTQPGSIRKILHYGMDADLLDRFIEGFESCEQYMRFECRGGVKLMTHGYDKRPSSWYGTRNGQHGLQWADAPPYSRMCSCAVNSSCIHNRMCNCESGEDGVDEGFNPHMQLLPVMSLYLGGTSPSSSLNVSIGPLICSHRMVADPVTFIDRNARLTGSQNFYSTVFDLSIHVRFTHSKMTIFTFESTNGQRWYQLYVTSGYLIGQVVSGGKVFNVQSRRQLNDDMWHIVYWEVSEEGMMLTVDGENTALNELIVLPQAYTWIIGSRTQRGSSGFAGMVRNVYLCGNEIIVASFTRKLQETNGVVRGEKKACRRQACANGGKCTDSYDSFSCNCTGTPFAGPTCEQDVGMLVPEGSQLSIPWQHPGQVAPCFRIAIQSYSSNYSLIRAKALFADSLFNLTVNSRGFLELSAYDGFFFRHMGSDNSHRINNNEMADIQFCADEKKFELSINSELSIMIEGNWTFFYQLNVWNFIDKNFNGCVMRLQVGTGFPLKDPFLSRLSHKGDIRFGSCPFDELLFHRDVADEEIVLSEIEIHAVIQHRNSLMVLTPIVGVVTGCAVLLFVLTVVCWIRNRPDGVYKTNENILAYCSPSRSEDPLVANNNLNKEYFC